EWMCWMWWGAGLWGWQESRRVSIKSVPIGVVSMRTSLLKPVAILMLAVMVLVTPATLLAQETKDPKTKKPADQATPAVASSSDDSTAAAKSAPKGKLTDEQNPLLIGKRDINKHQLNFYSLQKEVALGQQL